MYKEMNKKIAMVVGATSGIGAAFASEYARLGYELIITGRRGEKLEALASKLRADYKTKIEVVITELTSNDELDSLIEKVKGIKDLEILVNCAGFAKGGKSFYEEDLITHENMFKVHDVAIMKLTYAALPAMLANKKGAIINVSSIMAYFPFCRQVMYVATKAFVSLFTESLSLELKGTGVCAQVLCPGLTHSDFHKRMGFDINKLAKKRIWLWMPPMRAGVVVKKSLSCLKRNKTVCIPGWHNKLIVFMHGFVRLF